MSSLPPLDLDTEVRPHFPALKQYPDFIFADNAGGSQILGSSIQAISDYLTSSNVQLGGGYTHSVDAGGRVEAAKEVTALLTNVEGGGDQVIFGSSTTQLATNMGYACELSSQGEVQGEPLFGPDDEIIVTAADHEANVGPWTRLAKSLNLKIHYWLPTPVSSNNPFSLHLDPAQLVPLLNKNTRLVAFTAKSNLLGHATDVKGAVELIREKTAGRAMSVVDCVAYIPHSRVDMQDWGCDAVFFSHYKLYGPHLSCLVISPTSPLASSLLPSLGHYFHPSHPHSYKLAPGGAPYELQVGCVPILEYLRRLGLNGPGDAKSSTPTKELIDRAYQRIHDQEEKLLEILMGYLGSQEAQAQGIRVVGPEGVHKRAPTVSFVVVEEDGKGNGKWRKRVGSADIVKKIDAAGKIGLKNGHFYATRILPLLPLASHPAEHPASAPPRSGEWKPAPENDGVVRISLVHYNTVQEVKDLVDALKATLKELGL